MFVCFGVDARGGGSRGVLRECSVLSTPGPEPGDGSVSIVDAAHSHDTLDWDLCRSGNAGAILTLLHVDLTTRKGALRRRRRGEDVGDGFEAMFVAYALVWQCDARFPGAKSAST